jgi:proteasome accessory factor B
MAQARVGRPSSEYSQAARVVALYDRLHRGQTLSVRELAEALRVSPRTLQRDLAVLREVLGRELAESETQEPGVRLANRRRLKDITKWQVMGVSLGMQMVRFLSGRSFDAQMQPLLSALRSALPAGWRDDACELEKLIYVPDAGQKLYRANEQLLGILDEMVEGLLLQQPIQLKYLSPRRKAAGSEARALRIQALCLTVHRGAAYFVVDLLQDAADSPAKRVLLALDRMSDVEVDRRAAELEYPRDFRPAEHFRTAFGVWTGSETHEIRLHIDRTYASAVRERTWHVTQRLEELPDGSLKLQMQLGSLEEVADWILGMGEHARVEAPTQLVDKVSARLEQALRQYR